MSTLSFYETEENKHMSPAVPPCGGPPYCTVQRICSKGRNQGRPFASCSKGRKEYGGCNYFKWLDTSGGGPSPTPPTPAPTPTPPAPHQQRQQEPFRIPDVTRETNPVYQQQQQQQPPQSAAEKEAAEGLVTLRQVLGECQELRRVVDQDSKNVGTLVSEIVTVVQDVLEATQACHRVNDRIFNTIMTMYTSQNLSTKASRRKRKRRKETVPGETCGATSTSNPSSDNESTETDEPQQLSRQPNFTVSTNDKDKPLKKRRKSPSNNNSS